MRTYFTILIVFLFSGLATSLMAHKMKGKGENAPVVHSFVDGRYYVRSIPQEDYGTAGTTGLYRVTKDGDQLIDQYDVYMRGELFLGWLPLEGKWAIVQLEPERIVSIDDFQKRGSVARLVFYKGGKMIRDYSSKDLADMGLVKHYARLMGRGSFTVQGIVQVPRTNHYRFTVTKRSEEHESEVVMIDVGTGERLGAEQDGADQPATAPESKSEGNEKPKSELKGRSK